MLGCLCVNAQQSGLTNQAVVTIVGNSPNINDNLNDFINTNPYQQSSEPVVQQQTVQSNQIIEPTLENGFHVRFQVNSTQPMERTSSAGTSSGNSYNKARKHGISMAKLSFDVKKRVKCWLPERKKKYHPTLCGRF